MIELAHGLGMTVISEGVETAEQHEQLATLGSEYCQGFYFAHPMPVLEIDDLIHAENGSGPHLPLARPVASVPR